MNGVKNDLSAVKRPFRLTPWGYITLGVIGAFVGMVVGAGGEHAGAGFFVMAVASVPLTIGVIAEGVRVGSSD